MSNHIWITIYGSPYMDNHMLYTIYGYSYMVILHVNTGATAITLQPKLTPMVMVEQPPNCGELDMSNCHRRESHMGFCISLCS